MTRPRFTNPLVMASRLRTFSSSCWRVSSKTRRSSFSFFSSTNKLSALTGPFFQLLDQLTEFYAEAEELRTRARRLALFAHHPDRSGLFKQSCHKQVMRYLLALLFLIGALGCTPKPKTIEASFKNSSAHNLDWVRMKWAGPNFEAGILSIGISKTYIDLTWPNIPTGTVTFVDEGTRQSYNITLSFADINPKIQAGQCRAITILISDYDKAVVVAGSP